MDIPITRPFSQPPRTPMVFELSAKPGEAWLAIVSRPTLNAFSRAFTANPILEATCNRSVLTGVESIFEFFRATRSMYEHIQFVQQLQSATRVCLEWEGMFGSRAISGATILCLEEGVIERIRLYHYPYEQLNAFASELARRRTSTSTLTTFVTGANHEFDR